MSGASRFAPYAQRVVVHFRFTSPEDLTDRLVRLLLDREWVADVTLHRGVVLAPPGDLVECDVAREKAGELMSELRGLGLPDVGGIVITTPPGAPFRAGGGLEASAPGHPGDAVIWDAVEEQAEGGAVPTVSFHVFLVI